MKVEILGFIVLEVLLIHVNVIPFEIRERCQDIPDPHQVTECLNERQFIVLCFQIVDAIHGWGNTQQVLVCLIKYLDLVIIGFHDDFLNGIFVAEERYGFIGIGFQISECHYVSLRLEYVDDAVGSAI